jgi:hypothetical protein
VIDIRRVFLYTGIINKIKRETQTMMTKKDYIAIATILNKYSDAEHMILLKLCEYFKEDNPNFDADKFLDMVADDNIS